MHKFRKVPWIGKILLVEMIKKVTFAPASKGGLVVQRIEQAFPKR